MSFRVVLRARSIIKYDMLVIPLVLSLLGRQIPICSTSHEPVVSALQLLQSGILSLQPSECVPVLTPSG